MSNKLIDIRDEIAQGKACKYVAQPKALVTRLKALFPQFPEWKPGARVPYEFRRAVRDAKEASILKLKSQKLSELRLAKWGAIATFRHHAQAKYPDHFVPQCECVEDEIFETVEDPSGVFNFCDECWQFFHLPCVPCQPALNAFPEGDWECPLCAEANKVPAIMPEELMEFLFPEDVLYPSSCAMLELAAEWGPLKEGRLVGGTFGWRSLTKTELTAMVRQAETDEVVEVVMRKVVPMPSEAKEVVVRDADAKIKKVHNYPPEEVTELLSKVARDSFGRYIFDDFQKTVAELRRERVHQKRKMYPDVLKAAKPVNPPNPTSLRQPEDIATKKISDQETFKVMQSLMNGNVYKIAEREDSQNPALCQNVRLLRDPFRPLPAKAGGWDTNCCLRSTEKPSHVKTKNYT